MKHLLMSLKWWATPKMSHNGAFNTFSVHDYHDAILLENMHCHCRGITRNLSWYPTFDRNNLHFEFMWFLTRIFVSSLFLFEYTCSSIIIWIGKFMCNKLLLTTVLSSNILLRLSMIHLGGNYKHIKNDTN